MVWALWDWDSGRIGPREAEASQRIGPREAEAHGYSGAFPQRAFAEMTMADAEGKAVGFIMDRVSRLIRCLVSGVRGQ